MDLVAPLLVKLGFCRIRFWYTVASGSGISRETSRIFSRNPQYMNVCMRPNDNPIILGHTPLEYVLQESAFAPPQPKWEKRRKKTAMPIKILAKRLPKNGRLRHKSKVQCSQSFAPQIGDDAVPHPVPLPANKDQISKRYAHLYALEPRAID